MGKKKKARRKRKKEIEVCCTNNLQVMFQVERRALRFQNDISNTQCMKFIFVWKGRTLNNRTHHNNEAADIDDFLRGIITRQ